jgi:hypothetical protein
MSHPLDPQIAAHYWSAQHIMPPHISAPQAEAPAQTDRDAAPTVPPAPTSGVSAAIAPEVARNADPSPPPQRAKPVLASTLLSNFIRQHHEHEQSRTRHVHHQLNNNYGIGNGAEGINRVRSGFAELDDYVLMGGVDTGAVVGISGDVDGDEGGVGRLVSLASFYLV